MRSFEQYIAEAYNFRLGGSQQKGFGQSKPLSSLEEGDRLFFYHKNAGAMMLIVTNAKIAGSYLIINTNDNRNFEVPEKYSNDAYRIRTFSALATSFEDLKQAVKDGFDVNLTEKDVIYLDEAYSFRLGGSKQKGFGQTKVKTFGELEEGDFIYLYEGGANILKLKFLKFVMSTTTNKCYVRYKTDYESDNFSAKNFFPFGENKNDKTYITNNSILKISWAFSTDIDELLDVLNNDKNFKTQNSKKWTEEDVVSMGFVDEAYNFRLGGSKQKGFNQVYKKSFAELEDGDIIYYADRNKIASVIFRKLEKSRTSKFWRITYTRGNDDNLLSTTLDNPMLDVKSASTAYLTYGGAIGTNKADIIKLANKTWFTHYTEDDIQDLTEAYNFRLGGSQKKGFDQASKFEDLEKGDHFYYCSVPIEDASFCRVLIAKLLDSSKTKTHGDMTQIKTDCGDFKFPNDCLNKTKFIWKWPYATFYASTTRKEMLELIDDNNLKPKNLKEIEDEIGESYNFRLGGSQKKGFNQPKTFIDIEPGDKIYEWDIMMDDGIAYEYEILRKRKSNNGFLRLYYGKDDESDYALIDNDDVNETCVTLKKAISCKATTKEELIATVKKEFDHDIKTIVKKEQ